MNKFRKIISIYITITLIITSIQVFATKADTVDEIFVTGGVKYKITSKRGSGCRWTRFKYKTVVHTRENKKWRN